MNKRKFYEEGVDAIDEHLDKNTPAISKSLGELSLEKRKRSQLLYFGE